MTLHKTISRKMIIVISLQPNTTDINVAGLGSPRTCHVTNWDLKGGIEIQSADSLWLIPVPLQKGDFLVSIIKASHLLR